MVGKAGILPTTDAVIVLTQLAKDVGADRSVSEISVLPQHFKMDNLLIGLSFPDSRAREIELLKRDLKILWENH